MRASFLLAVLLSVFPAAAVADPVIWDNGDQLGVTAITSQLDSGFFMDSQSADDFVLPVGPDGQVQWLITGIRWWGAYQNQPPQGPPGPLPLDAHFDFNVLLYADNGTGNAPTGGPGDPTSTALRAEFLDNALVNETYLGTPDGTIADHSYEATPNTPFVVDANTKHWLSVQAVGDAQPRWFWYLSTSPHLQEGVVGAPVSNFDYWTNVSELFIDPPSDPPGFAFQLTGVPIPEPGTATLFVSGLLLAMRRCRRA